MRVLPLALWHRGDDASLVADAQAQSLITHGHVRSQVCCALYCLWARRTLQGVADPWAEALATFRQLYPEGLEARSELEASHRTFAIAHLLASHGNLRNPVDEVLRQYVRQCALSMTCRELALAGLFLARSGVLSDGTRLLSPREAKRINAVMLTCGTYDSAGEFAYRVGVPAKSGVGGGILAVVPGRGVICVWSPCLDPSGSSTAGLTALDAFTTLSDWTIF